MDYKDLRILPPQHGYDEISQSLLTDGCLEFLVDTLEKFVPRIAAILELREQRKRELDAIQAVPTFTEDKITMDQTWRIADLPPRLVKRNIDLGDVSPSKTDHLVSSLNQNVDGIQVDFDDGHCPTWKNQLQGWWNIYLQARGNLPGAPSLKAAPVMMLRPRAWNMREHSILFRGEPTPGPLVDFIILMYHNAHLLHEAESGPFFYLSKLESSCESELWKNIFIHSESQLSLPHGSVKACVLIENVLATFQLDQILYHLRDHSAGLNCGIWDYSASFINIFGKRKAFLLPDRKKYVNMEKRFLKSYMKIVVDRCRARGAPATGGMAAVILSEDSTERASQINSVLTSKQREIDLGVDGFLLYDTGLIQPAKDLWAQNKNRKAYVDDEKVLEADLLNLPKGGVTIEGLKNNVIVSLLFIENWRYGNGTFILNNAVEDSATAEISRSQLWQWIQQGAVIEETGDTITSEMVRNLVKEEVQNEPGLQLAGEILMDIVTSSIYIEFITTYLSELDNFFCD